VSQGLPITGVTTEFWGVPADPANDAERACLGSDYFFPFQACPSSAEPAAFLRNPTSCASSLETTAHASSWVNPGARNEDGSPDLSDPDWKSQSFSSHEPPGFPLAEEEWGDPVGITGCGAVPFNP